MGIFSKIKSIIAGPDGGYPEDDAGLEAVRREMRSHTRYPIPFFKDTSVKLNGGWSGSVMDISYGGIAVRFDAETCDLTKAIPVTVDCELDFLGGRHKFQMKTVRTIPQGKDHIYVGFCFNHSSPDTLVFLREVIEPIRHGRTLEELGPDFRSEKYQGKDWHCYRGDGPIDIIFQTSPDRTKLVESLMTFKIWDSYYEIGFQNQKIWTSKSESNGANSGPLSMGTKMIPSTEPDPVLLRRAFLILASAPVKSASAIRPLIDQINKSIRNHEKGAA